MLSVPIWIVFAHVRVEWLVLFVTGESLLPATPVRSSAKAHLILNSITTEWRRLVTSLKLPDVSFHALRHTHCSMLLDAGIPIATVSARMGNSSIATTLKVYAHKFAKGDGGARQTGWG